ncbi:protein-tyrosine-phosphatase [Actinorhabdospora filicis]|uniref:Protein-tyrosine-phosphatase n=1 Tax=Actinorhabdospora filicis TaxID=1785913 RepID=A0A9W6STC9_9ACTN|nr:protein phosphatase [Actinorhabdospora filicis]GLZ81703.1 protein-tyrosine-phosphatase [Actinorhabdospora filicis]
MTTWDDATPGLLRLPSGRLVRGRGLHRSNSRHGPPREAPDHGVYLLGRTPPPMAWETRWLRCRDFWTPDPDETRAALTEALQRSGESRVEVACGGGRGRTGLALACLAVLDGVPAGEAVAFVRAGYHPGAVETPWQKGFVRRFGA